MDWILRICGLCGLIASLAILVRGRTALRSTTLTAAAGWAICAGAGWLVLLLAAEFLTLGSVGLIDRLWYAAAVLSLCPPMAVLGSRRPTTRVWQWFVVLPMLVVLGLPLATSWQGLTDAARLRLEAPVLVGYVLVLVMSAGNYVGTRFTLPALLYIASLLTLAATLSADVPDDIVQTYHLRLWPPVLMASAVLLAGWRGRSGRKRVEPEQTGPDRLWSDFRNAFGIVWARRVRDRVNLAAINERWPVRLEPGGFVPAGKNGPAGEDVPAGDQIHRVNGRIEHTMRWLLRRFCDEEWIERRLRGESEKS